MYFPDFEVATAKFLSNVASTMIQHKIAYTSNIDNCPHIYVRFPDKDLQKSNSVVKYQSPGTPLWHPNGESIFCCEQENITVLDTNSSYVRSLVHLPEIQNSIFTIRDGFTCSPDGQYILFTQMYMYGEPLEIADLSSIDSNSIEYFTQLCIINVNERHFRTLKHFDRLYHFHLNTYWDTGTCCWMVGCDANEFTMDLWTIDLLQDTSLFKSLPFHGLNGLISPDGTQLLCKDAFSNNILLYNLRTGEQRSIIGMNLDIHNSSWAPNGQKIACMNSHHELWLYDLQNDDTQRLIWVKGRNFPHRSGNFYPKKPSWSPDGRFLWFALTKDYPIESNVYPHKDPIQIKQLKENLSLAVNPEQKETLETELQIQKAHDWYHRHKVGIIDFEAQTVWIEDGEWEHVTWAPI